ncbi:MAG: hypothetical protein US58_C0021G0011 [Candidatus Magasanikbacteria bacterium GW2011_GWA2_37_8]|uniref:Uncharacterized protein n=1 Tax=Candidatus Magasanikbacteria bacterium GW2011_GWA2_37_8 TaxID=1619036 RepID=A0A0G0JTU9_9BACT|nr:MAG: hypothetical protein US58_C0021G0011 [Candidatus Magasanikbacteria bacterium GW2011_GWA2_37_8]
MQKKLVSFLVIIFTIGIILFPFFAHAQYGLDVTGKNAGYSMSAAQATPYYWTSKVINTILGLTGFICFGFLLYAGLRWMTARGNEELATKAKDTIEAVIIGLIIIVSAYAISNFVLGKLLTSTITNNQQLSEPISLPSCDRSHTCGDSIFNNAYCNLSGEKLCCSASRFGECITDSAMTEDNCLNDPNICQPFIGGIILPSGGGSGSVCTTDADCNASQSLSCIAGVCLAQQMKWCLWKDAGVYQCYGTVLSCPPTTEITLDNESACSALKEDRNLNIRATTWCLVGTTGAKQCVNDPINCPMGMNELDCLNEKDRQNSIVRSPYTLTTTNGSVQLCCDAGMLAGCIDKIDVADSSANAIAAATEACKSQYHCSTGTCP